MPCVVQRGPGDCTAAAAAQKTRDQPLLDPNADLLPVAAIVPVFQLVL